MPSAKSSKEAREVARQPAAGRTCRIAQALVHQMRVSAS